VHFLQHINNNKNDARNVFSGIHKISCFLPSRIKPLIPPFSHALKMKKMTKNSYRRTRRKTCKNRIQKGKMLSSGRIKKVWMPELLEHCDEKATAGSVWAKLGLISSFHQEPATREHNDNSMRDKATEHKSVKSKYQLVLLN
jgi:hypothetical protein